jgi:hypothetical protein
MKDESPLLQYITEIVFQINSKVIVNFLLNGLVDMICGGLVHTVILPERQACHSVCGTIHKIGSHIIHQD